MESKSNAALVYLAVGCLGLILAASVVGFLFVSGSSTTSGPSVGGASAIDVGYAMTGGGVKLGENGKRQVTVRVTIAEDASLARFDLSGEALQVGLDRHPARLVSGAPSLPAEGMFELVFELPDVEVDEATPVHLRMGVNAKVTRGFFGNKTQSDRSLTFRVHPDRLELRTP